MATLMEAIEAAKAGKGVYRIMPGHDIISFRDNYVIWLNSRLTWRDSLIPLPICEKFLDEWIIEEPKPPEPEYDDMPIYGN